MTAFELGQGQKLAANDAVSLLGGLEAAIDFCLRTGNVFAIFDWGSHFCQLSLDANGDMHVESSLGELAKHAGFNTEVDGFPWLWGNTLPASWHARAKMAAGAMARAFIDVANIEFPAELEVTILATGAGEPLTEAPNAIEGAATIGFLFAADRPMEWFIEGLGPQLGLDPETASIAQVQNKIQATFENEYGPLNRKTRHPSEADYVVELGYDQITLSSRGG